MNENKIQHEVVKWFSQKYPQYRGLLFEVNNNPANVKHALKRRAMGMISGVSDLIFIIPRTGKVAGIEVKAPQSVHSKQHIENQMEWGRGVVGNRGFYLMQSDVNSIMNFIECLIIGDFNKARLICDYANSNIKNQMNKKTIKF